MATTTMRTRTTRTLACLNLRHYRYLGKIELQQLPLTMERLWLGPSFDSQLTAQDLVQGLPSSIVELDLDLTMTRTMATTVAAEGDDAMMLLTEDFMPMLFRRLQSLKSLCLRLPDALADEVVVDHLAPALREARCLTTLDLRQGQLGDRGVVAISKALLAEPSCSSVQELILGFTQVGKPGISALAEVLRQEDSALKRLDLSSSDDTLDDEAVGQLMSLGLDNNRTLRDLSLFCCSQITDVSGRRLLSYLRDMDHTALERLNLHGTRVSTDCLLEIELYLQLNRAGRKYLRQDLALSAWPLLLAKINSKNTHNTRQGNVRADVLRYFVRNNPGLLVGH